MSENNVEYKWHRPLLFREYKFNINAEDIILIAEVPKLVFDDEENFHVLVNREGKAYYIDFSSGYDKSAPKFPEKLIQKFNNAGFVPPFEECDYDKGIGKIIFPKTLAGKDFYKPNSWGIKSIFYRFCRSFLISHPAGGIFSDEVRRYIKSKGAL